MPERNPYWLQNLVGQAVFVAIAAVFGLGALAAALFGGLAWGLITAAVLAVVAVLCFGVMGLGDLLILCWACVVLGGVGGLIWRWFF
ncbi:MAG TPA: hypothetical protein VEA79_03095 [Phenylobacterium sp.]|nr:hypothetical protein [Phenylobacterium sp.]